MIYKIMLTIKRGLVWILYKDEFLLLKKLLKKENNVYGD